MATEAGSRGIIPFQPRPLPPRESGPLIAPPKRVPHTLPLGQRVARGLTAGVATASVLATGALVAREVVPPAASAVVSVASGAIDLLPLPSNENRYLKLAKEQLRPGQEVSVYLGNTRLQTARGDVPLAIRNAPSAQFSPSDSEVYGPESDIVRHVQPGHPVDLLNTPVIHGADTGSTGTQWAVFFDNGKIRFVALTEQTRGYVDNSQAALARVTITGKTPDGKNLIGTNKETGEPIVLGIQLPPTPQPK